MEHGDIIDIPYEPYMSRYELLSSPEYTYTYFCDKAAQMRTYLSVRGIKQWGGLPPNEQQQLEAMVDGYNIRSPFINTPVQIISELHSVTNQEVIWSQQGLGLPESGEYQGLFMGFELKSIEFETALIDLGLVAKTAVQLDLSTWLYFETHLDVGSAHPLMAELN